MKQLAVAFSGPSNSGKTTLILKVAKKLIDDGFKVFIVKHDPSDKAKFDVAGKDSFKFSALGAEVVVVSPTRTTYFSKTTKELDDIVKMVGEFDFLIVEGLKTWSLPRLSVFRGTIDESYLPVSNVIATDNLTCKYNITNFDLNNDIDKICQWVKENSKYCGVNEWKK